MSTYLIFVMICSFELSRPFVIGQGDTFASQSPHSKRSDVIKATLTCS